MKRPISQDVKDQAVDMYLITDKTAAEVAAIFGVCERTIREWKRKRVASEPVAARAK